MKVELRYQKGSSKYWIVNSSEWNWRKYCGKFHEYYLRFSSDLPVCSRRAVDILVHLLFNFRIFFYRVLYLRYLFIIFHFCIQKRHFSNDSIPCKASLNFVLNQNKYQQTFYEISVSRNEYLLTLSLKKMFQNSDDYDAICSLHFYSLWELGSVL